MNRRNKAHKLLVSAFAVLAAFALAGIDLEISAQNTNSSTTGDTTSAQNANTGTTRRAGRRGTRTRRTRSGNTNTGAADDASVTNANTNTSDDASAQNANTGGEESMTGTTQRGRRGRRGRRAATATDATTDTAGEMQTGGTDARAIAGTEEDLSGTYTGNVRMTGGHEMSGAATLTITGNSFTLALTDGAMTHSGTIRAVNSSGYIGAALRFSDVNDPAANNVPLSASVRARRSGDRLILTPATNARNRLWFTPGGGGGGGRRRGRRGRRAADTTTTTDTTTDAPPPASD